jgi:hypothetical protein
LLSSASLTILLDIVAGFVVVSVQRIEAFRANSRSVSHHLNMATRRPVQDYVRYLQRERLQEGDAPRPFRNEAYVPSIRFPSLQKFNVHRFTSAK